MQHAANLITLILARYSGAGDCRSAAVDAIVSRPKLNCHGAFAIAIDAAAMKRDGADSTDDYLADWRRASPVECGDDLDGEAAKLAADLEANYPAERVRGLVENGGFELDEAGRSER